MYDIQEQMGISPLWELGYRGKDVTVAVLDSGMKLTPSFGEKILYDEDFTGENRPRDNSYRHGNNIAECIIHIAPEATIANCRVFPTVSDMRREIVIQALEHCIEVYPRYRIVNMSLSFKPVGCPDNCPLCKKVDEAYQKGILVTVAAGNKGPKPNTLTCPALAHWALTTVATVPKYLNNYYYMGMSGLLKRMWEIHITGEFGKKYGTSYSTGYASGAAALLFSAFPKLDADTLRFALLETSETLRREMGHATTNKVNRVYDYLHYLQMLVSMGVIVTKERGLYPIIPPF